MLIPLPSTSLLGRDREIRAAREAVSTHRLVTFLGPGGIGKTRLAMELLNELDTDYETIALAELAHLDAGASLERTLGAALGVAPPDTAGWRHLDVSPTLIVLDNCEHVIEPAAALVASILQTSRSARVIATSRFALDIRGEILIDVPQLPVAAPQGSGGLHGPAVALFVERAVSARAGFSPTDDDLAAIGRICRDLDGVPLAIEIAAALSRTFPLERLADIIATDPTMLEHRRRDVDARHQSLAENMTWSRALLDHGDAEAFDTLSAFTPDFDLEAAGWMLGEREAHQAIAHLVQRSLLVHDAESGRYRMLGHVRRAVWSSLDAAHRHRLQVRKAQWCATLTQRWGRGVAEPETVPPELRREAGNLQDAVAWCLGNDEDELAALILGPVAISWAHMGWPVDVERWAEVADQQLQTQPEPALAMMLALSFQQSWAGERPAAVAMLDRVIELATDEAHAQIRANALVQRGHLEASSDPTSTRARAWFDQAIATYDVAGAAWGSAWARFYLGRWLEATDPEGAAHVFGESLTLIGPHAFPLLEGLLIERQAQLLAGSGRLTEALALASRSRSLHRSVGYPEGEATSANCEGFIHIASGAPGTAEACHRSALRTGVSLRHEGIVFDSLVGLAVIAARRGRRRLAARLAGAATRCNSAFAALTAERFGNLPSELESVLDDPGLASDRAVGFAADPVEVLEWRVDDVGDEPDRAAKVLVEPLSDRERTVLGLLRSDLTQREIAQELIVAPSTVKSHIKAIYRKLAATSRAEALDRARELGLIS